jgi:hypothetical protein
MFYAPGFDPYLIIYQILCVQSLMYLDLGLWICIITALTGSPLHLISLRQIFSHNAVRLAFATGWIPFVAYVLNAGIGCAAAQSDVRAYATSSKLRARTHASPPHPLSPVSLA